MTSSNSSNLDNELDRENEAEEVLQNRFSSPWHFSDVVLEVEGTKLHAHKSTLSIWSPVFEKMLTSGISENSAKEIPLPGKRANEIVVLLNLIYSSGTQQKVNESNWKFLLELADEYQMEKVKEFCVEYLENSSTTESNCLLRYRYAERFGLEDLKSKCIEKIRHLTSEQLEASDHFQTMELDVKVKLCMNKIKELENALETCKNTPCPFPHPINPPVIGPPVPLPFPPPIIDPRVLENLELRS